MICQRHNTVMESCATYPSKDPLLTSVCALVYTRPVTPRGEGWAFFLPPLLFSCPWATLMATTGYEVGKSSSGAGLVPLLLVTRKSHK